MSSNPVAEVPARSVPKREVIVEFDPAALRAPFLLRCGAAVIDYLVLMFVPVAGLLISRLLGNDGSKLVNSEINNFAWLISILVSLCNLILLPIVTGQSVGKMLTGLRIVNTDGHSAPVRSIVFRQTIGYFLTFLTGLLGFVFSIFNRRGRALHDMVSGTMVVFAKSRVR